MNPKNFLFIGIFFLFQTLTFANSQKNTIDESQFVLINGIEQWVTIKGDDKSNPVILFLHGGPGSTMSIYDDVVYGSWKQEFTLVNWDQRGAGRTYGKNNPPEELDIDFILSNPLTIEQMVVDGIALTEYLIEHLNTEKVILIGTSWGSILGTEMILKRPDLFHAYMGHSQVVNFSKGFSKSYDKVYDMAKKAADLESLKKLEELGAPPYDTAKKAGQLLRVVKKYEQENSTPAPENWWKRDSQYENELDYKYRYEGDDYSFINFIGHEKLGIKAMCTQVDFMKNGIEIKIPVYYIQGEEDILTPKEFSKVYFDKIEAPKKEYFLISNAAHGHNQAIVDMQYKIVIEFILPDISN